MSARPGNGRTALITGASAGIGLALARCFAAHGFDLVLTARREDRLAALARSVRDAYGVAASVLPADLANPAASESLVAALEQHGIAIDALVNNAGYSVPGLFRATDWTRQRDALQVLVTAPCALAHHVLPGMIARHYGRILNVASIAGLMPGSASHALYGGAKAMMIKFSQALHSEQKGSGVHVSALCPGFTRSEFHDVNGTRAAMKRVPGFLWLSADRVAAEGYDAVMRNRPIAVPGLQYKAIAALMRLLPVQTAFRLGEARKTLIERSP
jgi:short-subunit dehydrogenase